ncbi:MAG: tetratricopeptide repeat protein [Gemmatimonadota bacterium]
MDLLNRLRALGEGTVLGGGVVVLLGVGLAWGLRESARESSTAGGVPLGQSAPAGEPGPVAHEYWVRVDSLTRLLGDRPEDDGARLALARQLDDGHQLAASVEHYREYLRRNPGDRQAHFDLAKALGSLGNWAEAAAALKNLLIERPGDASAMYNLGAIEANRGRPGDAARWWNRVREETDDARLAARAEDALRRLGGDR